MLQPPSRRWIMNWEKARDIALATLLASQFFIPAALAQNAPSAPMTQRKIDTPGSVPLGPGDTDGHRAVYRNDETGELIYGDLSAHSRRVIFKAKLDDLPGWAPSRDFSTIFLRFSETPNHRSAFVNADGTGYREIPHLSTDYGCWNWSWDNRYILLCGPPEEGASRLVSVSVADGQIRELASLKGGTVRNAVFSPDGRFVAYELIPSAPGLISQIYVFPVEGGEPQLVYEDRQATVVSSNSQSLRLLDWTAAGRFLAIASESTGKGALELLPMRDGRSAGAPIFVRYGDFRSGVTTAAGGLVYSSVKPGGLWSVHLASLDTNGRPGDWKRLDLNLGNVLNPVPKWSPDSNQIVYASRHEDTGQSGEQVVRLRNLSNGEDRQVYHAVGKPFCVWAIRQPKLFCLDTAEKTEMLSLAIDSREIAKLHTFPMPRYVWIDYPSRDDRALYIWDRLADGESNLLQVDIATGKEAILDHLPSGSYGSISPDERWLVKGTEQDIQIRPTAGGAWKSLASLKTFGQFNLTPDGQWLLYHAVDSTGKHSLFRVATAGGAPERLGDFPTKSESGTLEVSPDGSKILASVGDFATASELWSLENFVPPDPKSEVSGVASHSGKLP